VNRRIQPKRAKYSTFVLHGFQAKCNLWCEFFIFNRPLFKDVFLAVKMLFLPKPLLILQIAALSTFLHNGKDELLFFL